MCVPGADQGDRLNSGLVVSARCELCIRFAGLAQIAKYTYYSLSERRMAPQPPANTQGLTLPTQLRRRETS